MRITADLADELAELGRLHEASRQDPHDVEIQVHYQELRARVPRALVAVFDSRRRAGRRPFAPLVHGACGACSAEQPVARQFGLRDGEVVTCRASGVVLFDPLLSEERTLPAASGG